MVSWTDTKGKQSTTRREVERVVFGTENKIRLTGDVLPRYVYWVTTNEGKKMPVECLSFDRTKEEMTTEPDPMKELPPEIYSEKPQFAYVCNAIEKEVMKLCDLKSTIYKQIVDYAKNPEYGNPADPVSGYDITIKKEKTGPLPQNVKYSCVPARSSRALTEAEKALVPYDLDKIYKRQTYAEQKQWLLQNTSLFAGLGDAELAPGEGRKDIE
jgi:hypothetical protein